MQCHVTSLEKSAYLAYTPRRFNQEKEIKRMPAKPAEKQTFEDALAELEGIVKGLESGQTKLEESIAAYTRGIELKTICETRLREAQSRIEKITLSPDGRVTTETLKTE